MPQTDVTTTANSFLSSINGHGRVLDEIRAAYQSALTEGDASLAAEAIARGLSYGFSPVKIYLFVLMPAQSALGELWHKGEITISQEHLGTQITLNQMAHLRQLFRPRCKLGLKAVVVGVDGDAHSLGGQVVADFLSMDGWDVDFLGTNTPSEDLVKFIASRSVDLVGLSVTMPDFLPALKETVKALAAVPNRPKVIVGGSAVTHMTTEQLAVDAIAANAAQAVEEARKLCGLSGSQASLTQYLKGLGRRILDYRKSRRFSQQELANLSGLDRAYISSVENGKQNLTIGAILKLAEAMDLALEDLLVERRA